MSGLEIILSMTIIGLVSFQAGREFGEYAMYKKFKNIASGGKK